MTHILKMWSGSFEAVASGAKTHDIRDCSDRKFTAGDNVIYNEWEPEISEAGPTGRGRNTGRQLLRKISYISLPGSWGLPESLCVFSIK